MPKRMRLPNGFGQITKLKQRLRKPYRAIVTVGFTNLGKPICKLLKPVSYFSSYNDAYLALAEYHRNPYDLNEVSTTVQEVYERWWKDREGKLSPNTIKSYIMTWKKCSILYNIPVKECRIVNIKQCLDFVESDNMKKRIKILLNMIFDYAIELELIDKNPARAIKQNLDIEPKTHLAFTRDEISILWNNLDVDGVDWILMQIYTGLRPTELLEIRTENINLEENYMIGGMKTKAGKDRIIPLHPRILELVKHRMNNEKLFEISYKGLYGKWKDLMNQLGLNPDHKPHDGRKTFITLAKKYNMDEYAIKRIVGHAIKDLTENVYTERDTEWLLSEIVKIP